MEYDRMPNAEDARKFGILGARPKVGHYDFFEPLLPKFFQKLDQILESIEFLSKRLFESVQIDENDHSGSFQRLSVTG